MGKNVEGSREHRPPYQSLAIAEVMRLFRPNSKSLKNCVKQFSPSYDSKAIPTWFFVSRPPGDGKPTLPPGKKHNLFLVVFFLIQRLKTYPPSDGKKSSWNGLMLHSLRPPLGSSFRTQWCCNLLEYSSYCIILNWLQSSLKLHLHSEMEIVLWPKEIGCGHFANSYA